MFKKKCCHLLLTGFLAILLSTAMSPAGTAFASAIPEERVITESCPHTNLRKVNEKPATCTEDGYTGDTVCSDCGQLYWPGFPSFAPGHIPVVDNAVEPTCITEGKTQGTHCEACNTIIMKPRSIPATGIHSYKTSSLTKATIKKNGRLEQTCTQVGCNASTKKVIYYPKTVQLSKTSISYNGKDRKPSVSIKDSKGNKINKKYYNITYKNNKNPGTATITITFQEHYKGTLRKTFQILPKATSFTKISAKVEGFDAKWRKQTSQVSGYQIQYSTAANFKKAKNVTVGNNKTVSKKISGLTAGQTYFVRIRTYKNVKANGKTKKLYSAWTGARSVVAAQKPTSVYNAMIALKSSYPEGMTWTNDNYYGWKGGYYTGGYGCAGFAFLLSDAAFGDAPSKIHTDFNGIRQGDIIRLNYNTHSVIVLEVRSDSVIVAEGNYNSSIHWGREISYSEIKRTGSYVMTRYSD